MVLRNIGIFILGLGAVAGSARGSTTYSSATTFNAAASSLNVTTITFTGDVCGLCTSVTDSSTTFNGGFDGLTIGTESGWTDGNVLQRSSGGGSISVAPTGPVYAFGLSIVTLSGGGFPIDIEYNDGSSEDMSETSASSGGSAIFFGVVSATPITSIQIVSNFNFLNFGIDDVELGAQAPPPAVPETRTMLLIGSGLILIHQLRRRQKRREIVLPQAVDRFA
jgi:hypothetical protein